MSSKQKAAARLRVGVADEGPGAAVLVLHGDAVLYSGQRGRADIAAGVAITPDTAFDLASVSKHVTAVALLHLVESGRLALDATVADVLPEWAAYPAGRPLRLTDLLWHTSGLPDYSAIWRGPEADARLTNARYLRKVLAHPPTFPAGSLALYSNTNYILLAAIIEAVSGRHFRDYVRVHLLEPLGMTGTAVVDRPTHPIANRAGGYVRAGGQVRVSDYPIALVGHSHLFTTTADLTRWFRGLWSGQVVSRAALTQALTPGRLDDGSRHEYGFGWYDDTRGQRPSMGHSGSWYGYAAYVRYYRAEELTLAVLSNDENFPAEKFVDRLAEVFFPGDGIE